MHVRVLTALLAFSALLLSAQPACARCSGAPDTRQVKDRHMNYFGILNFDAYAYRTPGSPSVVHASIIELPFFHHIEVNEQGHLTDQTQDWHFFALADGLVDKADKENDPAGSVKQAHLAILDCPLLFTLFEMKARTPNKVEWECLDLPLGQTLAHRVEPSQDEWNVLTYPLVSVYHAKQEDDHQRVRALEVPFIDGYRFDREKNGESRWAVLDIPLASLAEGEKDSKGAGDWKILSVPLMRLAKAHKEEKNSRFTLLEGPTVFSDSLFYLWRNERAEGKPTSIKLLKLPLIGPVLGWWSSPNFNFLGPFPNLIHLTELPETLK